MMAELNTHARPGEDIADDTLRPQTLDQFNGQDDLRDQLRVVLGAAVKQKMAPDHVLLSGPPGLGKTTTASIIANEIGAGFKPVSGPSFERPGDLAAILTRLEDNDVLFIDEIHRLPRHVEEILYSAMEDGFIDLVAGQGPQARSIRVDLAPFTLVGATTRAGLVAAPLRDRFGLHGHLALYDVSDLTGIVVRSARLLHIDLDEQAAAAIASRSRGTPRIANRLLRRVRDFAIHNDHDVFDAQTVLDTMQVFKVDDRGLDALDRRVLEALVVTFAGQATGLKTLSTAVGEEVDTIEDVVEPHLIQIGFIRRTPRGRVATASAAAHLGVDMDGAGSVAQPGLLDG
jgi:Holliday junction DNA helicase RuvB